MRDGGGVGGGYGWDDVLAFGHCHRWGEWEEGIGV